MLSEYLYCTGDPAEPEILAIAARTGLKIKAGPSAEENCLSLVWDSATLSLNSAGAGIHVDFTRHYQKLKVTNGFSRKSLLARAIGLGGAETPSVLDATAGLGKDTLLLAGLGCRVVACEKSRVLFELLMNGLKRSGSTAELSEALALIEWHCVDSLVFLTNDESGPMPDVIYLDPMYPEKKKSALPKKEMRILQTLLGPERNSMPLLQKALAVAKKRVVVKRPLTAEPLIDKPAHSYRGKTVRYDMYLARSEMDRP